MKRAAVLLCLCLSISQAWCQSTAKPVRFDFQSINVAQVLQLIYGEVLASPYVIDPDVLTDARAVSFRYSSEKGDIRAFLKTFLYSLGLAVETRNGIDFVTKLKPEEKAEPDTESFVYRPLHRDVHYIARLLSPLFKGGFAVNRSVATSQGSNANKPVPDGSAASVIDQTADALVFSGTGKEIDKLKKLLPQIDFALGEVVVRGVVYEVTTSDKDGSAFGLLASLLGGKLSIGIGSTTPIGSFVQFKNASLDGIYSALSQDSRFKVVSSPSLRIRSGDNGTFSVGQDVPVLGSVSYTSSGQAVQSVEYRSSGVIFNILPTVREGGIDLSIDQQLSNFIATTTGVNNSPTLTKRALKTSVGMQDGDLIVLGGLTENKDSGSRDGLSFLPKFLHTTGSEHSRSEILLVLQVQRI
ncbi:type II secretion system protein GspD [Rhodoferax sp.]|uniref:type II secretion system protein GspD n=1 Tax=Rhodoferax sp. TaxID=50421 RepID=UPI00374D1365